MVRRLLVLSLILTLSSVVLADAPVRPSADVSGGTPGGSDTQVQYNSSGSFGGDAGLTYDAAGDDLSVGDQVISPRLEIVETPDVNAGPMESSATLPLPGGFPLGDRIVLSGPNWFQREWIFGPVYNLNRSVQMEHGFNRVIESGFIGSGTCSEGTSDGLSCDYNGNGAVSVAQCETDGGVCKPNENEFIEPNWNSYPVVYNATVSSPSADFTPGDSITMAHSSCPAGDARCISGTLLGICITSAGDVVGTEAQPAQCSEATTLNEDEQCIANSATCEPWKRVCSGGTDDGNPCLDIAGDPCVTGGGTCNPDKAWLLWQARNSGHVASGPLSMAGVTDMRGDTSPNPTATLTGLASLNYTFRHEAHKGRPGANRMSWDFIATPTRGTSFSIEPDGSVCISTDPGDTGCQSQTTRIGQKISQLDQYTDANASRTSTNLSAEWVSAEDSATVAALTGLSLNTFWKPEGSSQSSGSYIRGLDISIGLDGSNATNFSAGQLYPVWIEPEFGSAGEADNRVSTVAYITLETPNGTNDASNLIGLDVHDLEGKCNLTGSNNCFPIRIRAQSDGAGGGLANKGNVSFDGFGVTNGHLMFAGGGNEQTSDHLWRDETNEVLRIKTDGVPTNETDGDAIVTGTGASTHGTTFFGDASASFDTGDEVCGAVGLTCRDTRLTGSAISVGCGTAHGGRFYADCS